MWPSTFSVSSSSTLSSTIVTGRNSSAASTRYCCQPTMRHERAPERVLALVVGRDDDADAVRADGLADRDAGQVVAALVEPAADRRVDADVLDLEQRFARTELGHRSLDDLEAVLGDQRPWAAARRTTCRFITARSLARRTLRVS